MKIQRAAGVILLILLTTIPLFPTSAQDGDNLLRDGDFEGSYTGRGRSDFNIPDGWNAWYADSPRTEDWQNLPPVAFPHNGPDPDPQSGARALNINKGFGTFTVAVYQQVSVPEGSNVQGTAFAWLHTCDIPEDNEKCNSSDSFGGYVRIGIDPNGGTSPGDGDIVWSDGRPHDQWGQLSVSATATGGTVTLFLYAAQQLPSELNKVYFDNAKLVVGGGGGSAPASSNSGGGQQQAPPPPPPAEVGFVTAQEARDDGSIVHIVRAGDTVDSIAVAYGVTRADIMELNDMSDARIIQIGQELLVRAGSGEDSGDEDEDSDESSEDSSSEDGGDDSQSDSGDEGDAPPPLPQEDAPPAPVVSVASGDVLPARDPAAMTASVCVIMFEDTNQNRIQEDGEALLAGGDISVRKDGEEADAYATDGTTQPHCSADLASGDYLVVGAAPDGYGLTTPNQLKVRANSGTTVNVAFGAAPGVVPAMVPPPDDLPPVINEVVEEPETLRSNPLMDNIGLIVFGLAGVVLVVGTGASVVLRRR